MCLLCAGAEPEPVDKIHHIGVAVPRVVPTVEVEPMKNFSKYTTNKSPRRIHRNIGGRKKGTLPGVPDNKGFGRHFNFNPQNTSRQELPPAVQDQMDWVKRETDASRDDHD